MFWYPADAVWVWMRVFMCMHVCGWVDVAHAHVVVGGGGILNQWFSFFMRVCIRASALMSVFLTLPPFPHSCTLASLACKPYLSPAREHSLPSISIPALSFKCICLSHPSHSSEYPLFFLPLQTTPPWPLHLSLFHLSSHSASRFFFFFFYPHFHHRCPCVVYLIREFFF